MEGLYRGQFHISPYEKITKNYEKIPEHTKASLIAPIIDVEIKNALFAILDNKSPGPYGYTSLFFKRS